VREGRDVAVVERNETLRCHRLVVKRAARPTARQVCAIRLLGSRRSRESSVNSQSDDVQRHLFPRGSQNAVEQFAGTICMGSIHLHRLTAFSSTLTPETRLVPCCCRLRWVRILGRWCRLGAPILQRQNDNLKFEIPRRVESNLHK